MPVESGAVAPWLDNWTIQRQLWQGSSRNPGDEKRLVPANRFLTVQWRDLESTEIVLVASEFDYQSPIRIVDSEKGIVEISLSGQRWNKFRQDQQYQCEIIAYSYLYDSFPFDISLPAPGRQLLSGVEIYGSPRKILALIGRIPGASVEISVDLSSGWTRNDQGYWVRSIPKTQATYGLFVNDVHTKEVDYSELGLGCDRQWARVLGTDTDTLYYKGPESLDRCFVETAFSWQVLLNLKEATQQVERVTGQFFNKQRVLRETHRGTHHQLQLCARIAPLHIDNFFRLDCYSQSRIVVRRYTEKTAVDGGIHIDKPTATITLTQGFWDWADWGNDYGGIRGFSFFTAGENNIELTYTAGYDVPPVDIAEAAVSLAAIQQATFWSQALTQGMTGISIGCVNMNFGEMFSRWIPAWEQNASSILGSYQFIAIEAF